MGVHAGYVSGQVLAGEGTRDWRPQFRLRPGQDDALIEWLCSMAPRRRSQAIREALHHYVASRQKTVRDEWDEDPDLAAALDSLF
jgi:hypothetical protein